MKPKFLFLAFVISIVLVGLVSSIDVTSRVRSSTGAAFTEISTEHDVSSPNSLRLFAGEITSFPPTNEARLRINLDSGTTLEDLESVSWMQFVDHGYISHVDVLLDTAGDGGGVDDALVFEYAKVDPDDCDDSEDYPLGSVDTFGDKGIVDDGAFAWLNSGPPGPCGDSVFDAGHKSLAEWKTAFPNAKIIALEIEVDGWIEESEAFIDDVKINDVLVEDFDGDTQVNVEILALTLVSISPINLDFGSKTPGTFDNPALNGPITFDATGSNTDFSIEVADVTGFPFEDGLEFDGEEPVGQEWDFECEEVDDICTYETQSTVPTLSIPSGAVVGEKVGTITYLITGPAP